MTKVRPFNLHTEGRGAVSKERFADKLKSIEKDDKKKRQFKAKPMFDGQPFVPAPANVVLTAPTGFPLKTEQRGSLKEQQLAQKLRKQKREERKLRNFKARELPIGPAFEVDYSERKLTDPESFALATEDRGSEKVKLLKEKLKKQEDDAKQATIFRAREYVDRKPFEVVYDTVTTEITEFDLQSTKRSAKRSKFDDGVRKKQEDAEEKRKEEEKEANKREEQEIKELRKALVHKPQPIVQIPMRANVKVKALTEPHSPAFETKRRADMRKLNKEPKGNSF
eukprot:TRINITY_DN2014_c0_g1_i4.p1 TRINITY_DN2014_c0_g1~~TRINITY_DN2014_c0_g1_i4.p1  ORF type:complete len:281 (-),score=75.08 TRINITY_DN2014_c0_g1_i4:58-900(-)